MLKVGDRVRILYAGPRPSLVGKRGTILHVKQLGSIDKYDYRIKVDGTTIRTKGAEFNGEFYFYSGEVEKI